MSDFRSWERRIRLRAQSLHPHDFWVNVRLGDLLLEEREEDEALQYLRAAVALRPTSAYALEKLGRALDRRGAAAEALAQLRRSISLDPQLREGDAYLTCMEVLDAHGSEVPRESLEALLVTLDDVVASGRSHAREPLTRLRAGTLLALGREAQAILVLEQLHRSAGRSFGPGFGRGRGRSSRRDDQLEEYRRTVRPDLVSFASIDAVFDGSGDETSTADTLAEFEALHDGTEANDARARVLYLEGRRLQSQGRHADAVSKFSEVVVRQDGLPEPFLRLAESLRASGEAQRALSTLTDALEDDGLDAPFLWKLWATVSFVDLGHSARQALEQFPEIPAASESRSEDRPGADLLWVLQRLASGEGVHINSGGDRYTGSGGVTWGRDRFFTEGSFSFFDAPRPGPRGPLAFFGPIAGTDDAPLYQTDRWFFSWGARHAGYEIPLPRGTYEVTLHFAEIHRGRDPDFKRAFDVLVEGQPAREGYEPGARGFATADHWSVRTTVEDGLLDVRFVQRRDQPWPKLSAIAVTAAD